MKAPHCLSRSHSLGPAMTPMIDVVFLLLIFFLSTTSFQTPEGTLPSKLHAAEGNSLATPTQISEMELERIMIEVTGEGDHLGFAVNGRVLHSLAGVAGLLEQLGQIDGTLPVILEIEAEIPLGKAIDVYDACRSAGFLKVQFAVSEELL
ncbi:ExbD/TolR family protein [Adhaeretor mobilis]|uniref:Biopolymer transport protein ExbD/TolR n=1 Tax=Adhaeretor mobilis TaxID=1930276 RepID=A0A517N1S1_9BACT|nr:biopolymer transporter ExbD [Adhaeretor mobilis]QDT01077.1 Biopolymer transport protein ExbD/TolR [Adhaeretor mobilis]